MMHLMVSFRVRRYCAVATTSSGVSAAQLHLCFTSYSGVVLYLLDRGTGSLEHDTGAIDGPQRIHGTDEEA